MRDLLSVRHFFAFLSFPNFAASSLFCLSGPLPTGSKVLACDLYHYGTHLWHHARKVSGQRILVMEWIDALGPASDAAALQKANLKPSDIMRTAMEARVGDGRVLGYCTLHSEGVDTSMAQN